MWQHLTNTGPDSCSTATRSAVASAKQAAAQQGAGMQDTMFAEAPVGLEGMMEVCGSAAFLRALCAADSLCDATKHQPSL